MAARPSSNLDPTRSTAPPNAGRRARRRGAAAAASVLTLLAVAACGGGSSGSDAAPVDSDAPWEDVVAAAEAEGAVTLYTSQTPDLLTAFEAAFEAEYDIDLTVVRAVGPDNTARIEQERASNRPVADMWVDTDLEGLTLKEDDGTWFAELVGPGYAECDVADLLSESGTVATVGAVAVVAGWNTEKFPQGLEDYPDLLDPKLKGGKIGIVEPVAAAQIDLYVWMEETFGEEFLEDLAAQEPRIYPSAVPMGQALASGEISASPGVLNQVDAKATGAPVDSVISPEGVWATRFFGVVLQDAPHPNAAQVLADFMVSPEGQAAINRSNPSVLPDIDGTLSDMTGVRPATKVAELTPEDVAAYKAKWDALFK